jgi:hypothetical protein
MNPSAAVSSRIESSAPRALSDAGFDGLSECEPDFHDRRDWCPNPLPTVKETVALLSREVATNVYLFSSALTNAVPSRATYLRICRVADRRGTQP